MRLDQLVAIVSLACVASSMPLPKIPLRPSQYDHGPFAPSGNVSSSTCKPSPPHRRGFWPGLGPVTIGVPQLFPPNPISSDSQVKDFFHDLEAKQDRLGPLIKHALRTMNATELLFLTQQVQEKAKPLNIRVDDNDGDCGDAQAPPPPPPAPRIGVSNGTTLPPIANTLPISSSNVTSAGLAGHKAGGEVREPPRN